MKNNNKIILLIIPVIFLAAGQISAKTGSLILASSDLIRINPFLLLSYFFLILRGLSWVIIIKHIDLSAAYPVMSINYIIVLFTANILFKESITFFNLAGSFLISAGILLILHDSLTGKGEIKFEN